MFSLFETIFAMETKSVQIGKFIDFQIQEVINQKRNVNDPIKHCARKKGPAEPPLFHCGFLESEPYDEYYFLAAKRLLELGAQLVYNKGTPDPPLLKLEDNPYKKSILHVCATNRFPDKKIPAYILSKLDPVKKRQLLDYPDVNGFTPLHDAVFFNNFDFARFLIENGAALTVIDSKKKQPPLFLIDHIHKKKSRLAFIKLFCDAGVDLTATFGKQTIADFCCEKNLNAERELIELVHEQRLDCLSALHSNHKNIQSYICMLPKELLFLIDCYTLKRKPEFRSLLKLFEWFDPAFARKASGGHGKVGL